jgi:transketolase
MTSQASLKVLTLKSKLAPTPKNKPVHAVAVKNLKGQEEWLGDPRATRALLVLMNQHAVIGGSACHWGGPSAFAEMMSSVHALMFRESTWYNAYNFINDAGHAENGLYALRSLYNFDGLTSESLKGFRSIDSKLTGHGEAHLNPEGVFVSNGPLGSGLPQAQGLALADGLTGTNRLTLCVLSDGGAMEGEAREAMAAIPGLAQKGKLAPFVLLISDNNTKLSGRIDKDSFSMAPTFRALEALGWRTSFVEDGHDLQKVHNAIERSLEDARADKTRPVALVLKTIKGKGVKSTEDASSGGHGYPLKAYDPKLTEFLDEIYTGQTPLEYKEWAQSILNSKPADKPKTASTVVSEKVQPGFSRALIKAAEKGLPVFSVTSDLPGSTGIADFIKKFPNLAVDIGVAEANMVSTAVGLSKAGFIPVVDTFAQFGVTKGNLPLIMASLSQGPVIALFSHTGFQDAADGASHQATTYFSAVAGIPHTVVISCASSKEAEAYMDATIERFVAARQKGETPESVVFFFGRENFPAHYKENLSYEWGKAQILRDGRDATIVATGPSVVEALKAADELAKTGVEVTVVNHPFINRIDTETIGRALQKTNRKLLTIEDHQLTAGMGAMLSHALNLAGHQFELRSLGIDGDFGQSAYEAVDLYKKHHIDSSALVKKVKELL